MQQDAGKGSGKKRPPAKKKPIGRPQTGDILVVSANLEETHDLKDIADKSDMRNFAIRVADVAPRAPDVILVQEVVSGSVEAIARYLEEVTGIGYTVGIWPAPKSPRLQNSTSDIVRDTAILLNDETMKAQGPKGVITTRYEAKDRSKEWPRLKTKEHVRLLAKHEPSGARLALMSVHLAPVKAFASKERFYEYTERWVTELCAEMRSKHPKRGRQINILAGDFNNRRCIDKKETVSGDETPMWKAMKGAGYRDAIFDVHGHSDAAIKKQYRKGDKDAKRIDYIFVNGGQVIDASHDLDPPKEGAPGFYSDHRLLWAVIRPPARKKK